MQINVLEYLIATAARFPDAVAFADEKREVRFAGLRRHAEAVGAAIAETGASVRRPAAVLVRRDALSVEGLFGALFAGCFYVPLDAAMPPERLRGILAELRPAALLYGEKDEALARSLEEYAPALSIADCFDRGGACELWKRALDSDPAYMIYTSGSTGSPKGILISHRSVIDFTDWYAALTGVTQDDRLGNQAPFFFDLSVKDLYLALKTGAACHILPKKCFSFPVLLIRALDEKRITTLSWATAAFHITANSGVLSKYVPKTIRRVLLGGEALQAKQLNIWRKALPDVRYVNLYGPTETTVDCTYYPIEREFADDEPIPIGKACENMEVLVLGEDDRPCAAGEKGEICARGTGIAIGYFADPEKTAAAFVQDPRNPNYPDRIYRTGDIGFWGEDGNLYYACRKDSQIKHSGCRIELGEIETAMNAVSGIAAAVCLFDAEKDRLLAVYEGAPEPAELLRALRGRLPKYMLPEQLERVAKLPRLPNGKLDRAGLKREYLS